MAADFALVELQDNLPVDMPLGDTESQQPHVLVWTKAT